MGAFHWDILWQSLLSLLRFVNTYTSALSQQNSGTTVKAMLEPLLASLALAVYYGESVLPVHAAYDDLVYKLVEVGPELFENVGRAFFPGVIITTATTTTSSVSSSDKNTSILGRSTDILLALTRHFHGLLPASSRISSSTSTTSHLPTSTSTSSSSTTSTTPPSATPPLFPREVLKLIKKGYESLRLPSADGIERWEKWREGGAGEMGIGGNNKSLVKKIGRVVVEDARDGIARDGG